MHNPNMISVPVEFQSAKPETEVVPVRFGEVVPHETGRGIIALNMTPEQTASKLAEKEANERMLQAATDSVKDAYAKADEAKHEQL
jgi:hypothetical protein